MILYVNNPNDATDLFSCKHLVTLTPFDLVPVCTRMLEAEFPLKVK